MQSQIPLFQKGGRKTCDYIGRGPVRADAVATLLALKTPAKVCSPGGWKSQSNAFASRPLPCRH